MELCFSVFLELRKPLVAERPSSVEQVAAKTAALVELFVHTESQVAGTGQVAGLLQAEYTEPAEYIRQVEAACKLFTMHDKYRLCLQRKNLATIILSHWSANKHNLVDVTSIVQLLKDFSNIRRDSFEVNYIYA